MEIEVSVLDEMIKCNAYHKRLEEVGERIWLAKGKIADAIYFDAGNGWCRILSIIPKKNEKK